MTSKNEGYNNLEVYDFVLTHSDVIRLMNDPSVLLYNGEVLEGQTLEIVVKKANGKELSLYDSFVDGSVLFRFRKVVDSATETILNNVDVP